MSDSPDKPKLSAMCPTTGQMVKPIQQVSMLVGAKIVIWWQCSACQGWHLQEYEEDENSGE